MLSEKSTRDGTIAVRGHDMKIWEEHVDEGAFKANVMDPALRFLRSRGWKITKDPEIEKRHKILSQWHRLGVKDGVEVRIRLCGRCLDFELSAPGKRYVNGHEKTAGLPYLTVKRLEVEVMRLVEHLVERHGYLVKLDEERGDMTAEGYMRFLRATCWHTKPGLGRADYNGNYNRGSADGRHLEDGQTVWFFDHKGRRLMRGVTHYNLNNMWWVLAGGELRNMGSHDIYAQRPHPPMVPRERERRRRDSIQRAMAEAIERLDFGRAEALRCALFPNDVPLVRVKKKREGLYYRPNSCGYTNDVAYAGLYPAHEFAVPDPELAIEPVRGAS